MLLIIIILIIYDYNNSNNNGYNQFWALPLFIVGKLGLGKENPTKFYMLSLLHAFYKEGLIS